MSSIAPNLWHPGPSPRRVTKGIRNGSPAHWPGTTAAAIDALIRSGKDNRTVARLLGVKPSRVAVVRYKNRPEIRQREARRAYERWRRVTGGPQTKALREATPPGRA